jgi:pyruvate kinase
MTNIKRTKILATLGPATDDIQTLRAMIRAGMNMVRLNFSHGTHAEHGHRIDLVREAAKEENKIIGLLADLQGPKIRIAKFKNDKIELKAGDKFTLDAQMDDAAGDNNAVGIDYKQLTQDVTSGDTLLLDDGRIEMQVVEVSGSKIHCSVTNDGILSNNKGINRKGGGLSAEALTEKDKRDLIYALDKNVDYVAISYPRSVADIHAARALLKGKGNDTGLIAKIERVEAVDNCDEIIAASDGIMVARGDLGVEIGEIHVPVVQKHLIRRARMLNKPVITATQMMETMITSNVPTRAEISDVANAVFDQTDAIMLSAESAVGQHPVLVVETMAQTCIAVEREPETHTSGHRLECEFAASDESIAMATMYTANHLDVKAIVALTETGSTTLWMSRIRSAIPIFGFSAHKKSLGRMSLYRGVEPFEFDITACSRDNANKKAAECLCKQYPLKEGARVILTKGDLIGIGGSTNTMKILKIGDVK